MDYVSVIVSAFNQPAHTEACLLSLYETDHGYPIAPIIVDNGSRKKTVDLIFSWSAAYDSLSEEKRQLILRPKTATLQNNFGFAAGTNAALNMAETNYICILHNDCIVFKNWLKEMVSVFDNDFDDEIAIVNPRTNYANEGSCCIPELREFFLNIKPPNKGRLTTQEYDDILKQLYPNYAEKTFINTAASVKVENCQISTYSPEISSFCMLTKASIFKEYGKFDEEFWPKGFEDKFWFRQIERSGRICMIANRAFVHHWGNATSDGVGFLFPEIMKINEEKYKKKCAEIDKAGVKALIQNQTVV